MNHSQRHNGTPGIPTQDMSLTGTFSADEVRKLMALHASYQQDRDLFSARERAHLIFVRWLIATGRLEP